VQGNGIRDDQTNFQIDGQEAMDASNETGTAIPSVDSISQFSVQTSNFGAENGRSPMQVLMVTKGGTNQFHGSAFNFLRNNALDSRNFFAPTSDVPKNIRNQFGFTVGGPIIRNKTFFFVSDEWMKWRRERIYNSFTVSDQMLAGNFGSTRIRDPETGLPCTATDQRGCFLNNTIPANRISSASRFFLPHLLRPNSPDDRFRGVAPLINNDSNLTARVDHQFTPNHRTYVRYIRVTQSDRNTLYKPELYWTQEMEQHNIGLNHNWTVTPTTLFTLVVGYLQSATDLRSPFAGQENYTDQAGIQGFPTSGREEAIGLPNITFSGGGYTGISLAANMPGRFARLTPSGKVSMTLVRSTHTIGYGYEYSDRRTIARHASANSRGGFTFNAQHTGNSFADFLLGLTSLAERNYPIATFGMAHSPYSGLYLQDVWRAHQNLTLTLGVRYDRWHEKRLQRNAGATFDPVRRIIIAGDDGKGNVDLTAQPVAPFLAAATQGLWISATEAGIPHGLFEGTGTFTPRLGMAWRPLGKESTVIRAGYGIYTGNFTGNIYGSQIIGPPYWTQERAAFTAASPRRWEQAFPANPQAFINSALTAAAYDVKPMKIHQFNVSIQKAVPWIRSAVTISYVGNRGDDLITRNEYNEVAPGRYTNLQAARPIPRLSNIRIYENIGRSWYNSLQIKAERRFVQGFSYTLSYAFARNIDEYGSAQTDGITPFAPAGYDRGRSELERRHIMAINSVWQLPVGRNKALLGSISPWADAIIGGWQLSGLYRFSSGDPLTLLVPGDTLGNGYTPNRQRPIIVGDFIPASQNEQLWYNPAAFVAPAFGTFGSSGIGLLDGPGSHEFNVALGKNFRVREGMSLQLRLEAYNAINHTNLGNPVLTIGQANSGRITSAGEARQVQLGMKFIF
jgi:hypothetical protein